MLIRLISLKDEHIQYDLKKYMLVVVFHTCIAATVEFMYHYIEIITHL